MLVDGKNCEIIITELLMIQVVFYRQMQEPSVGAPKMIPTSFCTKTVLLSDLQDHFYSLDSLSIIFTEDAS